METTIFKALAAINKQVGAIEKSRKNEQQGFKFRGIDDVMNELHSLFAANEVIIMPEVQDIESTERTNQRGTLIFYVKARIKYTFIAGDGSSISSVVVGEAMDSGDKATNKAMSIALKMVLLQMFLIPTEEDKDPDAHAHQVISKLDETVAQIFAATTEDELKAIWEANKPLQKVQQFVTAIKTAKAKLTVPSAKRNGEDVKEAAQ